MLPQQESIGSGCKQGTSESFIKCFPVSEENSELNDIKKLKHKVSCSAKVYNILEPL